ncbi:MAG: tetratricopeptide repeat protein [Peptoniphilus sp.]|nr:tetratricopeptide repeat protein [Peptoniphilus sp.]
MSRKDKKLNNYMVLAEDFYHRGEYEKSLEFYRRAMNFGDEGEQEEILFEIADIHLLMENFIEAEGAYRSIVELNENSAGAYYGLALAAELGQGNATEIIANYKKAIELDPYYDRAYYYLAHRYLNQGDREAALDALEMCVELDSHDYVSYNDMGSIYENEKNFTMAEKYFRKSLAINPEYFRALYNMGVVCKARGDNDTAMMYYKRAREFSDFENIYLNMSALYIEEGDLNSALKILTEGIELNADSVNLYYNRSCVHARMQKLDRAMQDYKSAVALNKNVEIWASDDPDLKDVIEGVKDDNNKNT